MASLNYRDLILSVSPLKLNDSSIFTAGNKSYIIWNDGRGLWDIKLNKWSNKEIDKDGYEVVSVSNKVCKFHRLMLWNFKGKNSHGNVTRHLDGNPSNNNISNLEWGSLHENINDSFKHGTRQIDLTQREYLYNRAILEPYTKNKGSNHGQSLLNELQVIEIMNDNRSYTEIGKSYSVSPNTIGSIKKGWSWNHVTKIPRRYAGDQK